MSSNTPRTRGTTITLDRRARTPGNHRRDARCAISLEHTRRVPGHHTSRYSVLDLHDLATAVNHAFDK